jgi:hypothetical protein
MNHLLNAKFSQLEDSRLALIESLKSKPILELETSPAPGKWSVSQVFYHLNTAENFSTIYVSKKRLDINNLKKTGLMELFKVRLLQFLFITPITFKAPAVLGDMPDKVDYKSIVAEWDETRRKLKELLESLPEDILYKNVFKQPAIGRINIYQMLDFMQAHFNRHQKQVERIIAK